MRRPLPVVVGLLLLAVLIAVLVAVGAWQGDLDRARASRGCRPLRSCRRWPEVRRPAPVVVGLVALVVLIAVVLLLSSSGEMTTPA